jgi:N-methylhydantoinase B
MPGVSAEIPLPSIEIFEAEFGGRIRKLEYVTDSAGAGQWRGGVGTEAHINLPVAEPDDFYLTACVIPNQQETGFAGGTSGTDNAIQIRANGDEIDIEQAYVDQKLAQTSELTIKMGGGVGWGNPLAREPERVLSDVLNGFVSVAAAELEYGVIIDPKNLQIDRTRTDKLRNEQEKNFSLGGT